MPAFSDDPLRARRLRRTAKSAGVMTLLLGLSGVGACAGVVFGGEFPLTAALWCLLLWPMAAASAIVWLIAFVKLRRQHQPGGFDVIMKDEPPR